MDRQCGTSLWILPVVLAFLGCGTDAGTNPDHAFDATGVSSEFGAPVVGSTGAPDDSGGKGTDATSTTSAGQTAGQDQDSDSDGKDDTGDMTKGDTGDSGGSTSAAGESTGADESTGGVAGPSFMQTVWPIFDEECGCHQDDNGAGKLRLAEDDAHANLVGQPSNQLPSMLLVEPGDPDKSYLWHKLNNTHKDAGGKGKKMPPGGLLKADDLAVVEQWIDGGALP